MKWGTRWSTPTASRSAARSFDSDVALVLPTDIVALEPGGTFGPEDCSPEPSGATKVFDQDLPPRLDGPRRRTDQCQDLCRYHVTSAGTVLWNGPMGAFEDDRFAGGTKAVAEAVASLSGVHRGRRRRQRGRPRLHGSGRPSRLSLDRWRCLAEVH